MCETKTYNDLAPNDYTAIVLEFSKKPDKKNENLLLFVHVFLFQNRNMSKKTLQMFNISERFRLLYYVLLRIYRYLYMCISVGGKNLFKYGQQVVAMFIVEIIKCCDG